jgi:hypothetical protein
MFSGCGCSQRSEDKPGYDTYDLKVEVTTPKADGTGTETSRPILCGRYIAFNSDVPFKYLMMTPGFYSGYSADAYVSSSVGARIVTKTPHTNDGIEYTMKLNNQGGSGLYYGNWRLADIYENQNTRAEIGTMDPDILDQWTPNYPLQIGGPLLPGPGDEAGQVANGLNDRVANSPTPDAWRNVIVPFVYYKPDLSGKSEDYRIRWFAAMYITSDPPFHPNDEVKGLFVEWVTGATGWSDDPSGPVYLKTVVLTE